MNIYENKIHHIHDFDWFLQPKHLAHPVNFRPQPSRDEKEILAICNEELCSNRGFANKLTMKRKSPTQSFINPPGTGCSLVLNEPDGQPGYLRLPQHSGNPFHREKSSRYGSDNSGFPSEMNKKHRSRPPITGPTAPPQILQPQIVQPQVSGGAVAQDIVPSNGKRNWRQSLVPASTFLYQMAQMELSTLREEEEQLLQRRRVLELCRLREPLPKWYSFRGREFHQEAGRLNTLLRWEKEGVAVKAMREELLRKCFPSLSSGGINSDVTDDMYVKTGNVL